MMLRILYISCWEKARQYRAPTTHSPPTPGTSDTIPFRRQSHSFLLPFSALHLLKWMRSCRVLWGFSVGESPDLGDDCLPQDPTFSGLHAFRRVYRLYSPDPVWPGVWHYATIKPQILKIYKFRSVGIKQDAQLLSVICSKSKSRHPSQSWPSSH